MEIYILSKLFRTFDRATNSFC